MSREPEQDPLAALMQQSIVLRSLHTAGDEPAVVQVLRGYVLDMLPSERRLFPKEMRLDEIRCGDEIIELAAAMTAWSIRTDEDGGADAPMRPVRLVFTSASMRIVQIRKQAC
jgi:hypothetical protein